MVSKELGCSSYGFPSGIVYVVVFRFDLTVVCRYSRTIIAVVGGAESRPGRGDAQLEVATNNAGN